jgi:hypothetical protein
MQNFSQIKGSEPLGFDHHVGSSPISKSLQVGMLFDLKFQDLSFSIDFIFQIQAARQSHMFDLK